MESDVFSAPAYGIVPGNGHAESNTKALQRAVDEAETCGGAQIYLPVGEYEFAGSIHIEVNSSTSGSGSLRISGAIETTLVQTNHGNLFVVTDADGEMGFRCIELDGLHFSGKLDAGRPV